MRDTLRRLEEASVQGTTLQGFFDKMERDIMGALAALLKQTGEGYEVKLLANPPNIRVEAPVPKKGEKPLVVMVQIWELRPVENEWTFTTIVQDKRVGEDFSGDERRFTGSATMSAVATFVHETVQEAIHFMKWPETIRTMTGR